MVKQPYVNKRSIVIHIGSYSKMLIFKPYNKLAMLKLNVDF